MGEQDSGFPLNARHALSNLRPRREGPGVLTHHLGVWRQQAVAVVQSSRGHLLQHRLAAAAVVTDGGGGGDFAGALAVTHWQERETHTHKLHYKCVEIFVDILLVSKPPTNSHLQYFH